MRRLDRPAAAPVFAVALAFVLAASGFAADRTLTASGTVTKVDAKSRTIVVAVADGPETTFAWTDETKISGTLAPGVRVTIRYAAGDDGRNLALQISVSRG